MTEILVTMSAYALGRELGLAAATAELHRQIEEPNSKSLPGVRTIARLRSLVDVAIRLDTGATCIAKARSRAFHQAYTSNVDTWVSVDDDVEMTMETAFYLLEAVRDVVPRIVIVPCLLRQAEAAEPVINVKLPKVHVERRIGMKGVAVAVQSGGFGCVAMNRAAMVDIAEAQPASLLYVDHDGVERLAVFMEQIVAAEGLASLRHPNGGARWYGEDLSFFLRVPKSVSVEALLVGTSSHAGLPLHLGDTLP